LPVAAAILGRRIYFPWGDARQYPNLFAMLAGRAGDRKSSVICLANQLAKQVLPGSAFLPGNFSPETLFEEYCEAEGGQRDKLWIQDEANVVLTDWQNGANGERVAARMLELHDCRSISESFRRNRKDNQGKSKRTVQETSTSVLFGATSNVASFQGQAVRAGMARRFLNYVADGHGRLITRPRSRDGACLQSLIEGFRKLNSLSGPMDFADQETEAIWENYQRANRTELKACDPLNDEKASRLSSAPMQVLHVAMIFQACVCAKGRYWHGKIQAPVLNLAVEHVEECCKAAENLERLSERARIASEAEVLLEHIRQTFRDKEHARNATIYCTRSELTKQFCNNSRRPGSLTPDDLYLRLIPELERRGVAKLCRKRVESGELYAFRAAE
jgi:hypothetical protein